MLKRDVSLSDIGDTELLDEVLGRLHAASRRALRAHDEPAPASSADVRGQVARCEAELSAAKDALVEAEGAGTLPSLMDRLAGGKPRAEKIADLRARVEMAKETLATAREAERLSMEAAARRAVAERSAIKSVATAEMCTRLRDFSRLLRAAAAANEIVRDEWNAWIARGAGFGRAFGDPAYLLLSHEGVVTWERHNPFQFRA